MRALVILWVVLFVITGCGDESPNVQHNSPPVIDYLIMPEKVSPGDSGVNESVTKSVVVQIVHALIVPGEEAAGIKLGDGFDRVTILYGRPSKRNSDFFAYWDPDMGLSGVLDGIGLVENLSIRKPSKAKTAGGVGIGTTRKRVEREFGGAEKIEEGGKVHWYWKKALNLVTMPMPRSGAFPSLNRLVLPPQDSTMRTSTDFKEYSNRKYRTSRIGKLSRLVGCIKLAVLLHASVPYNQKGLDKWSRLCYYYGK